MSARWPPGAATGREARIRRDLTALALGLACVLAWDFSGLDLPLSAWLGGDAGFPLRHAGTWASQVHTAGRWISGGLLLALLVDAAWPQPPWRRDPRRVALGQRRWTALATLAVLAAVPAVKRISHTSCPWDVVDFGGSAPYVPHWLAFTIDGGPGHCFPSGHAVAAFVFLVPVLAWRGPHPRAAARAGWVLALAGATFGLVQMVRGAHYLSHVLWSAWLCGALAVAADAWRPIGGARLTCSWRPWP